MQSANLLVTSAWRVKASISLLLPTLDRAVGRRRPPLPPWRCPLQQAHAFTASVFCCPALGASRQVCDFGLGRLLQDTGARSTSMGGMLNPRWLAPEVLTGGSATAASDVFSFAVVSLTAAVSRISFA